MFLPKKLYLDELSLEKWFPFALCYARVTRQLLLFDSYGPFAASDFNLSNGDHLQVWSQTNYKWVNYIFKTTFPGKRLSCLSTETLYQSISLFVKCVCMCMCMCVYVFNVHACIVLLIDQCIRLVNVYTLKIRV